MSTSPTPSKRARTERTAHDEPSKAFEITIANPHSFKALCDVVSNVLINVHFQLVQEKESVT